MEKRGRESDHGAGPETRLGADMEYGLDGVVCQASQLQLSHATGQHGSFADQVQIGSTDLGHPTPCCQASSISVFGKSSPLNKRDNLYSCAQA